MRVAVAIILDKEERCLITRRPLAAAHGGLWEFPGGKLELDETEAQALVREIFEETGLKVLQYERLGEIHHTYKQQSVCLILYLVLSFSGEARCCEGQMDLKWVDLESLKNYSFPEANLQIVELLQKRMSTADK